VGDGSTFMGDLHASKGINMLGIFLHVIAAQTKN
jgi:hypothetical protein